MQNGRIFKSNGKSVPNKWSTWAARFDGGEHLVPSGGLVPPLSRLQFRTMRQISNNIQPEKKNKIKKNTKKKHDGYVIYWNSIKMAQNSSEQKNKQKESRVLKL